MLSQAIQMRRIRQFRAETQILGFENQARSRSIEERLIRALADDLERERRFYPLKSEC